MKFRKKPVVVETTQYLSHNLVPVCTFIGKWVEPISSEEKIIYVPSSYWIIRKVEATYESITEVPDGNKS